MLQQVITRFQFLSGFSCVAVENTGMEMKTKPTHEITELETLILIFYLSSVHLGYN